MLGSMIIAPFAMELALKSIHLQQCPDAKFRGHDLLKILRGLPSGVAEEIERRFRQNRDRDLPQCRDEQTTARQIVKDWKDGFIRWRYLADYGSPPRIPYLQEGPILTEAILEISTESWKNRQGQP